MTIRELLLVLAFYSTLFVVVVYLTRAGARRILGAVAGGAVFGLVAVLAVVLGNTRGWWRVPVPDSAVFLFLFWLGLVVSCTPDYLILWRIVRRFGRRGLLLAFVVTVIIGPPRDYWIAAMFPKWMTFGPGIVPVLADAAVYALLVIVGYAVMYSVAGPERADALARVPLASG
jgi:hypothetical protein